MITALEIKSKKRENQMLQIFILFYYVQQNHQWKLNFSMCIFMRCLGYHKINRVRFRFHSFKSTFNKFFVTYDPTSCEVKFQCLLFKSRDILCCHCLRALSFERVDKVAQRYILEYWSKNVKRRHTYQN
ncbi:hypothetical protein Ahy_B03g061899 isoform B [Arachis hypogaea]|uniref:Protein FAR1-RELATED SEQUENCE n=1 Tax=Arachis hypogaea TaxID=3818 RepID=A0A444ZSG7_ARAHY|nr:hypothetical protein Ahy_B03g061899 isoform B [Arachis hypogaea]